MSLPNYNNEYPGITQTDETCFRFTDKSIQVSERVLFSNWWREQINQYGVKVNYYVNTYNTLSADNFYGEQPTQSFADPRQIVIAVTLNENAITLSKFGFESDDDITAYIHISSFLTEFESLTTVNDPDNKDVSYVNNEGQTINKTVNGVYDRYIDFGPIVEPKAGDVFELIEYGSDRPNNRQAKFFEITEKLDQDISQINNLQGHYVFLIKAKRLDYSFEPNINFNNNMSPLTAINEYSNDQVYEDGFAGRLPGGENPQSLPKREDYDSYDVDDISREDVFDMSKNDTDVYGDYY